MRLTKAGGQIAKNTRDDLERQLGRTVISSERASDYIKPIESKDAEAQPLSEEGLIQSSKQNKSG